MTPKVLITGGAGFAGAHICEHLLANTGWDVVVLDRLSYAGSLERLGHLKEKYRTRLSVVFHDFRAQYPVSVLHALKGTQYIIHNGAETHVERSLTDAEPFVTSNVLGTMWTLEAARKLDIVHYIQVSTDEVHGPAPEGVDYKEDAPIKPSNPYSASKASSEALAYSYWRSFGLPVTITRTMNLFGERQHPEKFIPMTMRKVLNGETVQIHGSADAIGSRKWLHARNQADALLFILLFKAQGETYHIAGEEHTNLEIAERVAGHMELPLRYKLVDFHSTRPGHDLRYSLDDSKLRNLGWKPPIGFEKSLERTVNWSVQNASWLQEAIDEKVTV